jgi:hypothetical protein
VPAGLPSSVILRISPDTKFVPTGPLAPGADENADIAAAPDHGGELAVGLERIGPTVSHCWLVNPVELDRMSLARIIAMRREITSKFGTRFFDVRFDALASPQANAQYTPEMLELIHQYLDELTRRGIAFRVEGRQGRVRSAAIAMRVRRGREAASDAAWETAASVITFAGFGIPAAAPVLILLALFSLWDVITSWQRIMADRRGEFPRIDRDAADVDYVARLLSARPVVERIGRPNYAPFLQGLHGGIV